MTTALPHPTATFVRAKQAARWLNVSKSTFHNWVRDGRLPAGIKLSPGVTVWNLAAITSALNLPEAR